MTLLEEVKGYITEDMLKEIISVIYNSTNDAKIKDRLDEINNAMIDRTNLQQTINYSITKGNQ